MKMDSQDTLSPEFRLEGKVVLLTGALGLIGTEVSDAIAAAGGNLVLADIGSLEKIEEAGRELAYRHGGRCLSVQTDISDPHSVTEMVRKAVVDLGRVDVFIHCAAIDAKFDSRIDETSPSSFEMFPLEAWERSVKVNVTGTFLAIQAVVKEMLKRNSGNIITVASTYSLVAPDQSLYDRGGGGPHKYKPADYVATKSLVPNFTRYLATTYARQGIRANCIVPHGIWNEHPEWFIQNFERLSPMGRMCKVSELRGPFIFLASDASSYMTGSTLVVDGGWTAW